MEKVTRMQDQAAQREEHEEMDVQPETEESLTIEANGKVADPESETLLKEAEEKNAVLEAQVEEMRRQLQTSQASLKPKGQPKGQPPKPGASPQELRARNARLEEKLEQVSEELQQTQALVAQKDQEVLGLKAQGYDYLQIISAYSEQNKQLQAQITELTEEGQAE